MAARDCRSLKYDCENQSFSKQCSCAHNLYPLFDVLLALIITMAGVAIGHVLAVGSDSSVARVCILERYDEFELYKSVTTRIDHLSLSLSFSLSSFVHTKLESSG